MDTAIYTITSELHDEASVASATRAFLDPLSFEYAYRGADFSDYGAHDLNLIFVRTGGSEGIIKPMVPDLASRSGAPFYLLASQTSNSLAASMEIISYLRQQGFRGEIIHGTPEYVSGRVRLLASVESARRKLGGMRLGVLGKPSDWLISSQADYKAVKDILGVDLVDVPMDEVKAACDRCCGAVGQTTFAELADKASADGVKAALPGAGAIYDAFRSIVASHSLNGLTVRCFDLLTSLKNTGCLALARLNSEGVTATCEGDVPAMLSMAIAHALFGIPGFQANPARIDPVSGEMLFAHCTIPFSMVGSFELDSHFESGIGVGVRGFMKEGDVTVFKVSGDLSRHFIAEGTLLRNQAEGNLCRTQQVIRLDDASQTKYFLTEPVGNHHIILPGRCRTALEAFFERLGC